MFITIACTIIVCAFIGTVFCVRRRRRRRARNANIYMETLPKSVCDDESMQIFKLNNSYFSSTVVILTLFAATMLWVFSAIDGIVMEPNLFVNETVNQPAMRQREPFNL